MVAISDINIWAILAAAVANMALGAIYYHPKVFGTQWMELSGFTMEDAAAPGPAYAFSAIGSVVSAVALSVIIVSFGADSWIQGIGMGALVGVGFIVPVMGSDAVFNKKPLSLFLLNVTYYVIGFIAMGAIIGAGRA